MKNVVLPPIGKQKTILWHFIVRFTGTTNLKEGALFPILNILFCVWGIESNEFHLFLHNKDSLASLNEVHVAGSFIIWKNFRWKLFITEPEVLRKRNFQIIIVRSVYRS